MEIALVEQDVEKHADQVDGILIGCRHARVRTHAKFLRALHQLVLDVLVMEASGSLTASCRPLGISF